MIVALLALALAPSALAKASTSMTVASSANPSAFGQSVSFTATLSPSVNGLIPSGSVTFLDGGAPLGAASLDSRGRATLTTPKLAPGSHTITATYAGDANFNAAQGSLSGNPQVVEKGITAIALSSSVNPSTSGQPVSFEATVSAAGGAPGTPTGSVVLLDGGTPISPAIALDATGKASFTTSSLSTGSHTITAQYSGDANFNAGTGALTGNPQVVSAKPGVHVTLTSSRNPSLSGQPVTFETTVSAAGGAPGTPTGSAVLLDGGTPISPAIALDATGKASFTTSSLSTGSHTITAHYSGDANFNAGTGALTGNPQVVSTPPPACAALPGSAAPPFTPSAAGPNERFVQAVFNDLLHRAADPAALSNYSALLGGGVGHTSLVLDIESSAEYRSVLVSSWYAAYLKRAPDLQGLSSLVGLLASASDEQVLSSLLASPEYLARAGGTRQGFVVQLYCDLLGRAPSASETQLWVNALGGGATLASVAQAALGSQEYRSDLINQYFLRFLRRSASQSERAGLAGLLGTTSDEDVIAYILGSSEYLNMFSPPAFMGVRVSPAVIKLRLLVPATISLKVLKVLAPGTHLVPLPRHLAITAAGRKAFRLPKLRVITIVSLGHHRAGIVTLHWRRKLRGHRLKPGRYELIVQLRRAGKLIGSSDPIAFTER